MLYCSFTTDSEPKVIGVRDGMAQVNVKFDRFTDQTTQAEMERFFDFRTYWQHDNHIPPRPFRVEYAELRSRAKLTDFLESDLYYMGCPFMLSRRAREVFELHELGPSYWFDVIIYDKAGLLVSNDYSLFYCPYLGYEAIDFARSRFRLNLSLPASPRWEYIKLPSLQTFEAFCNTKHKIPNIESLVMSEQFDRSLDYFKCRIGPIFMSERLQNAVKEAGLTNAVFPLKTGSVAFAD
ncbi:hypothetical protein ACFP2F_12135 [Hymenobacter artigasi]|uniref:Uncharacterized protein n=1 Tax=Hymenobacter artigasi TaxID=2719616 RepID=A0ABX1HK59_9BACT|nr:hypothetical protein [Hymenobacter artigasi]NKI89422.1 hypothetical protein [Hymenobacter artigasi]